MGMGGEGMSFGLEGGFAVESMGLEGIYGIEKPEPVPTNSGDDLMLSTAAESLKARPERLVAKSQKFYDITPATTISGRRKALEIEKIDIKKILKWLDEIWLDEEVRKVITEDEWREFVEAVKSELE